jgi:2-iminoacetate synthase ThiH
LGRASKWLTPEEKKIWRTLLRSAPAHLGENDRTLMEITCLLKAKLEKRTHTAREQSELINCLKQLGIIPKERLAVKPQADERDEWDEVDS